MISIYTNFNHIDNQLFGLIGIVLFIMGLGANIREQEYKLRRWQI
jgi:hypothetical protein